MAVEAISFKKLLKKTDDIYEAVLVSSKRARQILQDRVVKQMIDENEEMVDEDGIFAEPVVREHIDYDKEGFAIAKKIQNQNPRIPTIVFEDGSFLVEPSDVELTNKINSL